MATSTDGATSTGGGRLLFVVGTGRCGSTLVHEVLARHGDVGFVSNIEDRLASLPLTGRWNQALYQHLPPSLTRKGRVRFAPSEAYRLFDRKVSPMIATPDRDLLASDASPWVAASLREFFEPRMRAQSKPVFMHKFTGWPRIGLLHEVFPEARFVHIVRDGRAVANSWLQMPWWTGYRGPAQWGFGPLTAADQAEYDASGRSFVVLAAIAWKILMRAFDAARAALPPELYIEQRYEDIVAKPEPAFGELLDFAGLPHTDAFASALARYEFASSRTEAFRTDLTAESVQLLDQSLRPQLDAFGYA